MNKFNIRLKQLREGKSISQKDLAEILGITPRALRNYENGTNEPNIDKLITLSNLFETSIDFMVGITDNPKLNK